MSFAEGIVCPQASQICCDIHFVGRGLIMYLNAVNVAFLQTFVLSWTHIVHLSLDVFRYDLRYDLSFNSLFVVCVVS